MVTNRDSYMKTVHYLCAFILLLLIGCSSGGGGDSDVASPVSPTPTGTTEPTISLSSSTTQVSNGATFTVSVDVSNADNLFGAGFDVNYSTSKLELTDVEDGGFLTSPVLGPYVDGDKVAISSQAGTSGTTTGVDGDGTLCNITFKAKATGSVTISITSPTFYDTNSASTAPDIGSSVTVTIN